MKIRPLLSAVAVLFAATLACRAQQAGPSPSAADPAAPLQDIRIVVHTDKGEIEAKLFASHSPVTVANFLNLAQQKFYDGLTFHRVIPNFMIQGGDPAGTGGGGPGYTVNDETNGTLKFDKPGVFAMANRGANTNGSQFFITHVKVPYLDDGAGSGHYTIFGQVTKGQEFVDKITQGDHITSIDILDPTQALFTAQAKHIEEWNSKLTKGKPAY